MKTRMKTRIKLGPAYKDIRGTIQMLQENVKFTSCSIISSARKTTRATHYHLHDFHFCYVLKGQIIYYERKANSTRQPKSFVINEGELFYTPPMVEHEMFFPVATKFICLSHLSRNQANYEADTIRLPKKLRDIYNERERKKYNV